MKTLEVIPYKIPFRVPWSTAHGTSKTRNGFLIRTPDGAYGDAAPLPGTGRLVLAELRKALRGRQGPAGLEGPGRHGVTEAKLVQLALKTREPLHHFLGASARRAVPVNATIGAISTRATIAAARRHLAAGFSTIKVKLGPAPFETDRIAALRERLGTSFRLRLDPNGAWSPEEAADRIATFVPFQIEYIEQPIPAGQPRKLGRIAASSPIPIAPDEDAHDLARAKRLILDGSYSHIVIKPMMLGGLDRAAEAVRVAEDAGVRPIISDVAESGVGRAGALHLAAVTRARDAAHGLASGLHLVTDLLKPMLLPRDGALRVPAGPGLATTVITPGRLPS